MDVHTPPHRTRELETKSKLTPSSSSPAINTVILSPCRSPSQGGRLEFKRKISDSAVDWHNRIGDWNSRRREGSLLIKKICEIKKGASGSDTKEDADIDILPTSHSLPVSLETHTDDLLRVLTSMKKMVTKFEETTRQLREMCDLERHQNKFCIDEPLFKTWPTSHFYEASEELLLMYKKELAFKETVVHNVAHTTDEDLSTTMKIAWLHEPYIDERSKFILESILQETGVREKGESSPKTPR